MTDQVAILITLLAAGAGLGGALLGAWIAARATTAAAAATLESARADRREARRARFADTISGLAIEGLENADLDTSEVADQWAIRDMPNPTELPWRLGHRTHPVLRRLRMLVSEPVMRAAIDELEHAVDAFEALAVRTNKGFKVVPSPTEPEDRPVRAQTIRRYLAAVEAFELAVRHELGSGQPVD